VLVLHLVRGDLSPIENRISEYALGSSAPLMVTAFVITGVGILSLSAGLVSAGGGGSRLAPPLLAVAGAGMVLAGVFPTGRLRSGATTDAVHSYASALATMALIAGALTWSICRTPRRRLDTGLAVVAAGLGAASPALHRSPISGVSQRLLWLTLMLWLIVTAYRGRRDDRPHVSTASGSGITIDA
jgi:hypothetical membrane protein